MHLKVTENGIAERAGLVAGDIITKINEKDSTQIEHDEAKRQILACGNRVILSVLRFKHFIFYIS